MNKFLFRGNFEKKIASKLKFWICVSDIIGFLTETERWYENCIFSDRMLHKKEFWVQTPGKVNFDT